MSGARSMRSAAALAGAASALAAALLLAASTGALPIPASTTLRALVEGLGARGSTLQGAEAIVWNLRLPRVLMAALVGASLGSSGAAMQGLFRNPLADPYLLGIAGGASLGATLAMNLGGSLSGAYAEAPFAPGGAPGWVPLFAFAGACLAVIAVMAVARAGRGERTTSLLLSGIVVGAVLISLNECIMLRDADRMRAAFSWTLGSLSYAGWGDVAHALPYAIAGMVVLLALARGLDALALGEETARTLGVNARALRAGVIIGASLATAGAVAFVGVIGFVGLVAPHVMRRLGTPRHRVLIPASALAGGALLVLADLGARTVTRPAELPVGIVTTLAGGPFFLWLLRRET